MDLLVGIVNLVLLLFVIEAWVKGRIPTVLAKATADRIDDPASPANARLDRVDRRTDAIGARLDGIDRRLDELDTRLDGLDGRLGGLDDRLDRVDAQIAVLNAQTSQQITDLDRRVRERLRGLERRAGAPRTDAGGADAGRESAP